MVFSVQTPKDKLVQQGRFTHVGAEKVQKGRFAGSLVAKNSFSVFTTWLPRQASFLHFDVTNARFYYVLDKFVS